MVRRGFRGTSTTPSLAVCEHGDHELGPARKHQRDPIALLDAKVAEGSGERLGSPLHLAEAQVIVIEDEEYVFGIGGGSLRERGCDGHVLRALRERHGTSRCTKRVGPRAHGSRRLTWLTGHPPSVRDPTRRA